MAEIRKKSNVNTVAIPVFIRNDSPIMDPSQGTNEYKTAYDYVQNTLIVTLNGMRMREGQDYDYVELGGNSFQFNFLTGPDDSVICDYIKIMS